MSSLRANVRGPENTGSMYVGFGNEDTREQSVPSCVHFYDAAADVGGAVNGHPGSTKLASTVIHTRFASWTSDKYYLVHPPWILRTMNRL